ncbi:MAG: hypothetical protein WCS90_02760 [Bacilli bacterium]
MKRTRFQTKVMLILALGGVVVLESCGKSLTRSGAMSLLESIADHVGEKDFTMPTSYSVEFAEKGNDIIDEATAGTKLNGSVTQSVNFSFGDSYYHSSVSVSGKTSPATTLAYTSENWVYVDITQASGATLYYLIEASWDGTKDDDNNKTYTLTSCPSLEDASKAFLNQSAVAKEAKRRDALSETPKALKTLLGQFDQLVVKKEEYSTTGDYDIEASVAYQYPRSIESASSLGDAAAVPTYREKIEIKNSLLLSSETGTDTLETSTSYSWNGYKPSKPDLSSYKKDSSAS